MRMKLLGQRERTTAESFLLCSNGKSSQEMEREDEAAQCDKRTFPV